MHQNRLRYNSEEMHLIKLGVFRAEVTERRIFYLGKGAAGFYTGASMKDRLSIVLV